MHNARKEMRMMFRAYVNRPSQGCNLLIAFEYLIRQNTQILPIGLNWVKSTQVRTFAVHCILKTADIEIILDDVLDIGIAPLTVG